MAPPVNQITPRVQISALERHRGNVASFDKIRKKNIPWSRSDNLRKKQTISNPTQAKATTKTYDEAFEPLDAQEENAQPNPQDPLKANIYHPPRQRCAGLDTITA